MVVVNENEEGEEYDEEVEEDKNEMKEQEGSS